MFLIDKVILPLKEKNGKIEDKEKPKSTNNNPNNKNDSPSSPNLSSTTSNPSQNTPPKSHSISPRQSPPHTNPIDKNVKKEKLREENIDLITEEKVEENQEDSFPNPILCPIPILPTNKKTLKKNKKTKFGFKDIMKWNLTILKAPYKLAFETIPEPTGKKKNQIKKKKNSKFSFKIGRGYVMLFSSFVCCFAWITLLTYYLVQWTTKIGCKKKKKSHSFIKSSLRFT